MAATPDHPHEDGSAARAARAAQVARAARGASGPAVPRGASGPAERPATGRVPSQRGAARSPTGRAPLPVAAVAVTLWAALMSMLPVTAIVALAQLADAPTVSVSGVLRYGLAAWLLGHGVPLTTGLGPVGLAPLAVAGFAAWRLSRAGVRLTRAIGAHRTGSPRRAAHVALAAGTAYGCLGGLAAVVARGPGLAVAPLRAGLTLGVFGVLAALAGALSATGAADRLVARTPAVLRDGTRTGVVAALLVLGAGAALAGTALAVSGADASETLVTYRTGVAGQAGLTLLCLVYAPNAAIWAASYLLGPGFAVGVDTTVRTGGVTLGALPAVPVFAALPSGPVGGGWVLLLGAPLAAGMAAGWLLARRQSRLTGAARAAASWPRLLGGGGLAGPVAGVSLGVAAYASAGPLGAGRLAMIGPVGWQVALVGAGVITVGGLLGAAAARAVTARVH